MNDKTLGLRFYKSFHVPDRDNTNDDEDCVMIIQNLQCCNPSTNS